jgi:hypothetical protein
VVQASSPLSTNETTDMRWAAVPTDGLVGQPLGRGWTTSSRNTGSTVSGASRKGLVIAFSMFQPLAAKREVASGCSALARPPRDGIQSSLGGSLGTTVS